MKRTNHITPEQYHFISMNKGIFTSSVTVSPEYRQTIYDIYNHVTGENKRPGGCGRCWSIVKQNVWASYLVYETKINE